MVLLRVPNKFKQRSMQEFMKDSHSFSSAGNHRLENYARATNSLKQFYLVRIERCA